MADRAIEEVVSDIGKLEERVKYYQATIVKATENNDLETLSTDLVHLARVNTNLGRLAKYVMYLARNAEHAYKAAREQYKLNAIDGGKSATYGDTQRYIKSTDEHQIWSYALLIGSQAEETAFRTDTFLKMGQSKSSLLKGDMHGGR